MGRKDPAAHAAYMREWRAKRARDGADNPARIPHGTRDGYSNWGCRCADCLKATLDECSDYPRNRDMAKHRVVIERIRDQVREPDAPHHGEQWTGADLELVMARRESGKYVHGLVELARMLGRTVKAVESARDKCLRDPKWMRIP